MRNKGTHAAAAATAVLVPGSDAADPTAQEAVRRLGRRPELGKPSCRLRPRTALTQVAQAIAKAEWRAVPQVRCSDDVGSLAQAFSLMTPRLSKTLEDLRRTEAKLEEAQRVAHLGYWERDLNTNGITWSDESYRIFGLTPGEGPTTLDAILERIHPQDRTIVSQAVMDNLRGAPPHDLECRVVRPNGESRVVHIRRGVTRDASGRPRSTFGTIQDITDRKRAEAAAQENAQRYREVHVELAHANRVTTMGQLSASIAHEVKQPIAAVAIHAHAALRWLNAPKPNLEEVQQALTRIVGDCNRAANVVDRTRDLIKKAPPRNDRLDINEAIREVLALTRSEAAKNRVSVQAALADGLPLIQGDRVQLQQVALNLIVNAVEALSGVRDGIRKLVISTRKVEPSGVLVAVQDSGPGLDSADLERVFETFYTTKPGGLGLGLSICRSIIETNGGRLWATTSDPRGAIFQFTVPARPDISL